MNESRIVFDYIKASGRLRSLRKTYKLSHETLAKEIGVSAQTLKDYEQAAIYGGTTGRDRVTKFAGMSINTLCALAKYFNVSTDYLLGLWDEPNPRVDERTASMTTGLSGEAIRQLAIMCKPEKHGGDWSTLEAVNLLIEALEEKDVDGYALVDIANYFKVPNVSISDYSQEAVDKFGRAGLDPDTIAKASTKAIEAAIISELEGSLRYIKKKYRARRTKEEG